MNLYNEARSLANTVPFIRFALGPDGTAILQEKDGYVALPEQERTDMLERIGGSGMDSGTTSDGPSATYVPPTESSATAIRQGISLSALTLAAAIGVFVV
jgi:hypothetical protein